MKKIIKELLYDKNVLIEKIKQINVENISCSYTVSELVRIKWRNNQTIEFREAFISLLAKWVDMQNSDYMEVYTKEKEFKSIEELLTKLFNTDDFSSLNVKRVEDSSILNKIRKEIIYDDYEERFRLKEIKSFNKAKVIEIYSPQNKKIFFGECSRFYFMISEEFLWRDIPFKNIYDLLFNSEESDWVRKRPGMWVGSMDFTGAHKMIFRFIMEILIDSTKKEMDIKLFSDDTIEIVCESYKVENNTYVHSQWTVVNCLSEYFFFQDVEHHFKTEKGKLKLKEVNKERVPGIKVVFKIDKEVFEDVKLNYYWFLNNFMELAALNPFKILLSNEENKNIIFMPEGAKSLFKINDMYKGRMLSFKFSEEDLECEIAFYISLNIVKLQRSYVNNYLTIEGGTHVDGMLRGINSAILRYFDNDKKKKRSKADLLWRFDYIINVKMKYPRYQGNFPHKLKNIEVIKIIERNLADQLYIEFKKDPELIECF